MTKNDLELIKYLLEEVLNCEVIIDDDMMVYVSLLDVLKIMKKRLDMEEKKNDFSIGIR